MLALARVRAYCDDAESSSIAHAAWAHACLCCSPGATRSSSLTPPTGWGLLEPDGPLDSFLDDIIALAWQRPLRFLGLLLLVVAGASFLALVSGVLRWHMPWCAL